MKSPRILLLSAPGLSGGGDAQPVLKFLGADPRPAEIGELSSGKVRLFDHSGLLLSGGPSHLDALGEGQVLSGALRVLVEELKRFVRMGRAVLAVGSGFQALVKCGLLPASGGSEPTAGFSANDSGRFESRWVHLRLNTQSHCPFFEGLPEMMELPIAHAQGKLVLRTPRHLEEIKKNKSIAMQYVSDDGKLAGYPCNPDGSIFNIAALTNPRGNCLGLMPRPERFTAIYQHPNWTRQTFRKPHVGLELLRKFVEYAGRL